MNAEMWEYIIMSAKIGGGAIKICQICIKDSNNKVIITCDNHHYCKNCFDKIYSYLTSEHNSCVSCLENTKKLRK
jgi:hypothetical protein